MTNLSQSETLLKTVDHYNNSTDITAHEAVNKKDNFVLMGLDISPKYCGIAVTDSKRIATKALFTIRWNKKKLKKFLYSLNEMAILYKVNGFVIGLPVNVYEMLPQSKVYITTIGHHLKQITNLPYFFQDEHLSTVMSTAFLRGTMPEKKIRQRQNEIAASYILQSFLEDNRDITVSQ
jgi:putative Holliday junction resolvase